MDLRGRERIGHITGSGVPYIGVAAAMDSVGYVTGMSPGVVTVFIYQRKSA